MGESGSGVCALVRVLQLLPEAPDVEGDARNGKRAIGSHLEFGRTHRRMMAATPKRRLKIMPNDRDKALDPEKLESILGEFRMDIIACLTGLSTEISALQTAVVESGLPQKRLQDLREAAKKIEHQIHDRLAQSISLLHQLR